MASLSLWSSGSARNQVPGRAAGVAAKPGAPSVCGGAPSGAGTVNSGFSLRLALASLKPVRAALFGPPTLTRKRFGVMAFVQLALREAYNGAVHLNSPA